MDLGLKFAPEKNFDHFEAFIDLQTFLWRLNIKKHFALNENKKTPDCSEFCHTTLRNNSIFNPNVPGNECMGAFNKMVESDLKKLKKRKSKNRNIWKLIKDIGKKRNVVIRSADKGGGLVILNKNEYEEEMENLLKVENTYKKLKGNPKQQYVKKLRSYVNKGRDMGILSKKEAKYLIPESTRTPVIYYLQKYKNN